MGEILVPGSPQQNIQFIDARDLAEWTIRIVEAQTTGIYNAVGPERSPTLLGFLTECRRVTNSNAAFVFVDEAFCEAQGIAPVRVNCWAFRDVWDVRAEKALAAGLTYRPTEQTISETLAWDASRPQNAPRRAGLELEQEREALQAWHESAGRQASLG